MDSIQFIKVRKYVNLNVDCKRRRQSACTLTEHSDFVGFSNYKTSTLLLVNRRITTAMFSIIWNLFALQIWNHYDSDMSGYLDGDEIDAFLRDMLQQQGCSASTQLIKDYKQFIVRYYVLNCNICVSQIPRRENGQPLEDYGHAVAIPICKCLCDLIRPIPSGAKRIVRSNKLILKNFKRR